MSKLLLARPDNAPNFCFEVVDVDTGESIQFVQSDWDYAPLASSFGWCPCPYCTYTDGTVPCDHRSVSEMLSDAFDYLCQHEGDIINA